MIEIDFSPIVFKDKNKEMIQREAYNKWLENDCRGTIEIGTGIGKTLIGIMAIHQKIPCKVIIVVPKIDLQEQWIQEINDQLGDYKSIQSHIGKIGAGYKDIQKNVKICVINSIRGWEGLEADLLIMDEIHRVGSVENIKFLQKGKFKAIMGLSATVERPDGSHREILKHAPMVYKYSQKEAIENNLLTEFELVNVSIKLTPEEISKYNKLCSYITHNFPRFNNNFNTVQRISVCSSGLDCMIACDLMRAFNTRKQLLLNAKNRIIKTVELIIDIKQQRNTAKILVFTEFISAIDNVSKMLKDKGISHVKYHSKLRKKDKDEMLSKFKNGEADIMLSVKSLDEGTNVPDCDTAIIMSGSSVKRQVIQRLGRILRTAEGKELASVYQLYIPDTKDYDWFMARHRVIVSNAKKVRWIVN